MQYLSYGYLALGVFTAGATLLQADIITVYNQTNEPLYARIYYQKNNDQPGTSGGPAVTINPQNSTTMERPPRKLSQYVPPRFYDRNLFVSHRADLLQDTVNAYTLRNFAKVNIGNLQGSAFYFADTDAVIHGYNQAEWFVVEPFMRGIYQATTTLNYHTIGQFKDYVRSHYQAAKNNPHKNDKAYVQLGNNLSVEERNYLEKRIIVVKKALEKLLHTSLDNKYIPKIACVFSGGGHRAMISTIGSLIGCNEIGLMDAITWNVGLSGSTWALASWLVSELPIPLFSNQLFASIGKHITKTTPAEMSLLTNALIVKWAYDQPITIVDIYGALLANRLFAYKKDDRQRIYLSQQRHSLEQQSCPLPLFTAIQTGSGDLFPRWYEFSPYQIGSAELGMYVQPWAFGRKFVNGESQDYAPEQTLGFLLGTFGSAFAAPYVQIYKEMTNGVTDPIKKQIIAFIAESVETMSGGLASTQRIKYSWASVYNFSLQLRASPISNSTLIRLSDAGITFNLPYPPISGERPERKADIILFFDYSGGIHTAGSLRKAEEYARRKNLPFPIINYTHITQHALSIFKDETNAQIPVVIYIPLVRNQELWNKNKNDAQFKQYISLLENFDPVTCTEKTFCSTTNFEYSQQQAQQLAAHTTFTVLASQEKILDAIRWVIDKKS